MMEKGMKYLKDNGIDSFELSGILVVPVSSPEEIETMVPRVKRLLKECGYEKSWAVDPYYYDKHTKIEHDMYGGISDDKEHNEE